MDNKYSDEDTYERIKAMQAAEDAEAGEFAHRFNSGKVRFELIEPDFEEGIARVLTFGATKYGPENWKSSYNTEKHNEFVAGCHASLRRHLHSIRIGEWLDAESGLPHVDHVACNLMFIRYYEHED